MASPRTGIGSHAHQKGRAHLVALVVLAVLLTGLAAWIWQARPRAPGAISQVTDVAPSDRAVEQALALARGDSVAVKSRWQEEVQGVDLVALEPARREIFLRFVNAERCTCGCGYTLAGCRASDMSCDVSGSRVAALLDSVRKGWIHDAAGIRARPASGG